MATKKKTAKKKVAKKQEQEDTSSTIVPPKFRDRYAHNETLKGTCGDVLAVALKKAKDQDIPLETIHLENDIAPERWCNLNPGQRRMNLGNVLRARFKKGEKVYVDGKLIKTPTTAKKKTAKKKVA